MPLEISHLTVQYKTSRIPVINQLELDISDGKIVLILGRNGSGKSTLLRSITKQFFPGSLSIIEGKINTTNDIIRVFQRVRTQILSFSVKEELGLKMSFAGYPRKDRIKKIIRIAQKFGITELLDKDPHQLSSGQLQLVIVLSLLIDIQSPSFLLLDEPFSLLDSANEKILQDFLIQLKNDGHSIVLTSAINRNWIGIDQYLLLQDGLIHQTELQEKKFKFSPRNKPSSQQVYKITGEIGYSEPIKSVNFTLPKTGIVLVTGPNGSGKTTLLLSLSRIIPMKSGSLTIDPVFFLPQDPLTLFWRKNVKEEFNEIPDWMEQYAESSPFTLSEGERKKIAIHMAIITKKNLALDEPTQSLDISATQWFLDQLEHISQDRLVLIATNDSDLINLLSPWAIEINMEQSS